MSLLAITFAKAVLSMYGSGNGWIILLMFPFLFYIFFKYFREMRVLQGKWDGAMCRQCCPQNCCSFLFCLKPIKMSKQRLKRRLNYLTKRFNDHAPYWQFVIWARQISILIANFNVLYGFQYTKWILSIIVICICFVSLILHMHVKPYKYEFQNEVDKWLLIANIIIVFTATIYS